MEIVEFAAREAVLQTTVGYVTPETTLLHLLHVHPVGAVIAPRVTY